MVLDDLAVGQLDLLDVEVRDLGFLGECLAITLCPGGDRLQIIQLAHALQELLPTSSKMVAIIPSDPK